MENPAGRLRGKSALITGGAGGIGLATARLFLAEGANVVIGDLDPGALRQAVSELREAHAGPPPERVAAVAGDVRSMAGASAMVAEAVDRFGRLDVLFCNAGIPSVTPIGDLAEDEWDDVIATNLKGMFTAIKSAIPHMRAQGGGVIITMGSELGIVAVPESPAYCASKGAVILFTRSIALDLIRDNIRVNSLCPGVTRTRLLTAEAERSEGPELTRRRQEEWAPINRIAEPDEIAQGALFLASGQSSFAVGSALVLDGGYTAR